TWKIGLDWRPGPGFGFRTMLQRAVRAPNFQEAFSEQVFWDDFLVIDDPTSDPCSAASDPVGDGNIEKCIATGLPADQVGVFEASQFPTRFISGGNPDLEPEVADTLTMGFVFTPESIPDLQVSVDYFDIQIEGEIGSLAAMEACFDPANTENLFCNQIIRDPVTYNVSEIREFNINRGLLRTTGIDTQVNYSMQLPPSLDIGGAGADLFVNVVWTHVKELSGQNTPFSTVVDCAGTFGWPCTQRLDGMTWPTDRVATRLSYISGDFAANLNWRWIGETDNGAYIGAPLVGIPVSELDLAVPDVAERNYFDVSFSYAFSDHVMALLTVANLTETDPPLMADWVWDKNTDTRMYDIFGRSYTLSLSFDY
ncbi:MAG: TonB-dependent receptor, partial [Xanthomonadales bacterium]|nr:TonB-dependent receptor [Xanthomonadales bacterium]NIX11998.1 TonB-dependent receptor [Xanthomonadales bacterium]